MIPYNLNFIFTILILICKNVLGNDTQLNHDENEAKVYMEELNSALIKLENKMSLAVWHKNTNGSSITEENFTNTTIEYNSERKRLFAPLKNFKWQSFQDEELKIQFEYYSKDQKPSLPNDKQRALESFENALMRNYRDFRVCHFTDKEKCDLEFNADILPTLGESRDSEELKHYWIELHKMGVPVRSDYAKFVELKNEESRLKNFKSTAESWLVDYGQDDFEDDMLKLWLELQPLYFQLHAYVRKKLYDQYGPEVVNRKGPIPVHLFGDILGQQFNAIESFARPFRERPGVDISSNLKKQNYTAMRIFKTAEKFFLSINFPKMTDKFWQNSIFEKLDDGRKFDCQGTAYHFYNDDDFRISMCTHLDQINFETVHHEMGHIETFMLQSGLPLMKRYCPIAGIDEAIGEAIALSVMSPKHLKLLGLLEDFVMDEEIELNNLFSKAATRIALLPFALMIELYRYSIFRGETNPEDYNCHYWKFRESFQGVEPPVNRTEADFDPPPLFHFSNNVEYFRYYVSFLLMFQFHAALCEKAGQYVPGSSETKLSDCDIYGSTEAGEAFKAMLSKGSTFSWPETIELLTGQKKINTKGILEYFSPLKTWLEQENNRTGEYIGWEKSTVEFCTAKQEAEYENARISKLLQKKEEKINISRTLVESISEFLTNVTNYFFNFISLIKS